MAALHRALWMPPGSAVNALRLLPATAYQAMVAPLVDWTLLPGGLTTVGWATAEYVASPAEARRALRENDLEQGWHPAVAGHTKRPNASRSVEIGGAEGTLRVLSEDPDPMGRVVQLLDGLRVVGPWLDHGYATLGERHETRLPPPPQLATDGDQAFPVNRVDYLLAEWTPDAYLAQVLTGRHLAKRPVLDDFDVEPLANDRYLVVARDLAPWTAAEDPDPETRERARRDFAPMLITPEVIAAHPRPIPPRRSPEPAPPS